MKHQEAKERIEELKGYYSHLATFVGVNLFLMGINLLNYEGQLWFLYPLFGWGIGLFSHTITVFTAGHKWEDRKMQELTGLSVTQDELEKLSERTDRLVTILSSINWEKIDPDLIETRQSLEDTRDTLASMRGSENSTQETGKSKKDVVRDIEKLEKFVTSTKFKFYDQAQTE
jgi:hypothetical protein